MDETYCCLHSNDNIQLIDYSSRTIFSTGFTTFENQMQRSLCSRTFVKTCNTFRIIRSRRYGKQSDESKHSILVISQLTIISIKNYEILVRDVYAFGPLLIKYVDIHRSYWLKTGDHYAEQLYNDMAEVFSTWYKSKV